MSTVIGTNKNSIVIVNQDANSGKLNCLITNDQTVNNQTPTTYDAICEIRSSNGVGTLLLPTLTNAQAMAMKSPVPGMQYYDSDLDKFQQYSANANSGNGAFVPLLASIQPSTTILNSIVTWGDGTGTTMNAGGIQVLGTNDMIVPVNAGILFTANSDANSTNYVTIGANSSATTDTVFLFPAISANADQVLTAIDDQGNTTWSTGISSVNVVGSTGISVSGQPITSGSGTFTVTLNTELQGLSGLNATGLVTRIGTGGYAEATITANSANMVVTNGNGVAGNPTIDLSATPIVSSITIANTPVASTDGVNKAYADALVAGLDFKNPCVAASTGNYNATYYNGSNNDGFNATLTNNDAFAAFSIDSYSPNVGERVLIRDQVALLQNGIYTVSVIGDNVSTNWVLTRATDYEVAADINPGNIIAVEYGVVNAGTTWLETSIVNVIGTDPITFSIFSYGSSAFLQANSNLSDVGNATTAVANLGLSDAALANTTNPATAGYVPFSNNANGTDLVGNYGVCEVYADLFGDLNINGGRININAVKIFLNPSQRGALFIPNSFNITAPNGYGVAFGVSNALAVDYTITLPTTSPFDNAAMVSDTNGNLTWQNAITSVVAGNSGDIIVTPNNGTVTVELNQTPTVTSITTGSAIFAGFGVTNTTLTASNSNMATTYSITLPNTVGNAGQALITDGGADITGIATTSWSTLLVGPGQGNAVIGAIATWGDINGLSLQSTQVPVYIDNEGNISTAGTITASNISANGGVTSVATGTGLTGGPITSTGTISIANTAVMAGNYNYGSFAVNSQGQLTSANSGFVNTGGVGTSDTAGFATLNGTTGVTINTSSVTTNSIITVTRNAGVNTPPDVTTIGNLIVGSINATNSFTVYSTTANDLGNFNWLIINP